MKLTKSTSFNGITETVALANYLTQFCSEVKQALTGLLTFTDNIQNQMLSFSFTAANTSVQVSHKLGRVPAGYIVIKSSAAVQVFDGTSSATASTITLQASGPATCTVMVI